jgi:hypothetical protein
MATKVYETKRIRFVDGTTITASPLKLKYLRDFLSMFEFVKDSKDDKEAIEYLTYCALIAMQQYYPQISTVKEVEDSLDLPTIYEVLEIAAGIKIGKNNTKDTVKDQAVESGSTWEKFDLAKLEAEAFLLGIWKDYEELESSISMPELTATIEARRELDYQEKKFLAAIQGVDLDKQSGKKNAWEEMKARVFSGGKAGNANDVVALQGANAQKAGFGIGMGLSYEKLN